MKKNIFELKTDPAEWRAAVKIKSYRIRWTSVKKKKIKIIIANLKKKKETRRCICIYAGHVAESQSATRSADKNLKPSNDDNNCVVHQSHRVAGRESITSGKKQLQ